jgi:hypothetical protein
VSPTPDQARCASLPASALAALADLRRNPGLSVAHAGDRVWVTWTPGDEAIVPRLMAIPGVELYDRRDDLWFRRGCRLPSFGLPPDEGEAVPLHRAIVPGPVESILSEGIPPSPARLTLTRDDRVRAASALLCPLVELASWAELATSAQLADLGAARDEDRVLLRGRRLPPIVGGERFWGERVLAPLGFRAEPDLPEPALRRALGTAADMLLVLRAEGVEVVPLDAFRPLTRAGVRLALGEDVP